MKIEKTTLDALIQRHKNVPLDKIAERNQSSRVVSFFENRVAFSVSEVAFQLGLSVRTIERMIQRREFIVRKVGKRILIPKNELEAWLNRKE